VRLWSVVSKELRGGHDLIRIRALLLTFLVGALSLQAQLGRGRGGGFTQPQTEQEKRNIAVVLGLWREVWEGRNASAIPKYLAEGYVEHNNGGSNGREAMVSRFGGPRPAGFPDMKVVSQTACARGEYVLLLQNREIRDPADPSKVQNVIMVEMFRVYDGLLQEHWMFFPQP
jgi:predicted SnoaL-like aldol condensation-catalyzing enzyme